jgi:hypothetical protein
LISEECLPSHKSLGWATGADRRLMDFLLDRVPFKKNVRIVVKYTS